MTTIQPSRPTLARDIGPILDAWVRPVLISGLTAAIADTIGSALIYSVFLHFSISPLGFLSVRTFTYSIGRSCMHSHTTPGRRFGVMRGSHDAY